MAERRRTERVFLRIPIEVHGVDHQGKPFSEQTATIEVNRDGARIGLQNKPRLGAEIRMSNLATRFTALFRVILECPQSYGSSPEWGVALSQPLPDLMSDFWGIAFEDLKAPPEPHIAAPLLCRLCGRQELANISEAEYQVLLASFVLTRVCVNCHQSTEWEPSQTSVAGSAPAHTEAQAPPPERPGPAGSEPSQRRGARRVAVHVPIQIKTGDGRSEETLSNDISRTGLSFLTNLDLGAGDAIQVVVGYGIVNSPRTQNAWVVWRRPESSGPKALVGVRFATAEETETARVEEHEGSLVS